MSARSGQATGELRNPVGDRGDKQPGDGVEHIVVAGRDHRDHRAPS
jgi:hypothetical protein